MVSLTRNLLRQAVSILILWHVLALPARGTSDKLFDGRNSVTAEALSRLALTRNPGVKAREAAAQAAQFRVAPAGALDDPTLNYAFAPATADSRRKFQQVVELSQPLPWPGKLGLRQVAARRRAAAAIQDTGEWRLEVGAAAKSLFSEWAYVHRALAINRVHRRLLEDLRHIAETRYAAGLAGQQDALQAEVARTRLATAALTLERRRKETRARINALLNRPSQAKVPPPAPLPGPVSPPRLAALQRIAVQTHPALARLRAQVAEAEAQKDLARKDFYPDFRVKAAYNNLWEDTDKRWTVGFGINLPLNYGGKRSAALDAARAELQQRRWQLTEREAQLLGEIEAARSGVQETEAIIGAYRRRLLPLARDSLAAARADYRAGAGPFINVIDAERERLRTEDGLARVRADYLRRLAELERRVGAPMADAFEASNFEAKP
ncbi:TolC family protein [Methylohalobius crimeensis]|uniref:TolC family protein n=1 Tax=Methylohalobius crimeensis TaxID=244365 RepID=UPI0003B3DDAD|nr:TolC family protein [Methylohalobius crimeensis]